MIFHIRDRSFQWSGSCSVQVLKIFNNYTCCVTLFVKPFKDIYFKHSVSSFDHSNFSNVQAEFDKDITEFNLSLFN